MSKRKSRRTPNTRKRKPTAKREVRRVPGSGAGNSEIAATGTIPKLSLRQFSELVGRAPATVSKWCANGMPHESLGKNRGFRIDVRKACPWLTKYAHDPRPESERERLLREQADKIALGNAETRRNVVDAVQLHDVLQGLFAALRREWTALADRTADDLATMRDPQDVRARLGVEFAAVGDHLADAVGRMAAALEDAGAPG